MPDIHQSTMCPKIQLQRVNTPFCMKVSQVVLFLRGLFAIVQTSQFYIHIACSVFPICDLMIARMYSDEWKL